VEPERVAFLDAVVHLHEIGEASPACDVIQLTQRGGIAVFAVEVDRHRAGQQLLEIVHGRDVAARGQRAAKNPECTARNNAAAELGAEQNRGHGRGGGVVET
jgi:hypothetical protein